MTARVATEGDNIKFMCKKKTSLLHEKTAMWSTGARKPGHT